jgi:hypothetical protein
MPKKKTHKLVVNYTIPYFIFGIVSCEKGVIVSNELNCLFELKLSLFNPIEIQAGGNIKSFERFSCQFDDSDINYSLISISSKTGPLIETYRDIDYFLIISGTESATINKEQILEKINSPLILAFSEIVIKTKKEKEFFQEILQQIWI